MHKGSEIIEDRLKNTSLLGKHLVGARFDPNLRKAVDVVTESRSLFDVALQSDQK